MKMSKNCAMRDNIEALREQAALLREKCEEADCMATAWLTQVGINTVGLPPEDCARLGDEYSKFDDLIKGYWSALQDAAEGFGFAANLLEAKANELEEILERNIATTRDKRHFRTRNYQNARYNAFKR